MAGILLGLTLMIGLLCILVGMGLASLPQICIEEISVGVLPLLVPHVVMLLILVLISAWEAWLPDLVHGPN